MNLEEIFQNDPNIQSFTAGHTLFTEGDPGEYMYVVITGNLEIQVRGQVMETAVPGDILGEMALIEHGTSSAAAIARTDVTLVPIDQKRFTFLVQETPYFALHVMKVLADRLGKMNKIV